MHSKNKKGLSENSPFLLASAKCITYVVSFDTTMLDFVPLKVHFIPDMWYFLKYHEMYHICGIFLIPQEGKKLPLDVPFPENMVLLWTEGNGRRLPHASRCMWINPLVVCVPAFVWEVTFNPQNSLISFFMGIFANEKGTGIKTRSFFERLYQCQNITHDGLNSHPLLGNDNSRWTIRSMIRCLSNRRHLLFCKIYS